MVELTFCDRCDASVPQRASRCPECGAAVPARLTEGARSGGAATRRSKPAHRATNRRARASAKKGLSPFAIGTIVVVVLIGVAGWFVTQKEARRVEGERLRVEAEEAAAAKEKQDRLVAKIEVFRDAWSRSDIAGIGALYPRSETRRAERLPDRFATRGWADALPILGPPRPEDRDNPFEAGTRLSHPAGDVQLVWQYSQPEWTLRFLKLPSADAVAAYENRGKRPVATEKPPGPVAVPFAKSAAAEDGVVLRLIAERPEAFSPFPTARILRDYFSGAFGIGSEETDLTTGELIDRLAVEVKWPVETRITIVDDALSFCLSANNDKPFLMDAIGASIGRKDRREERQVRAIGGNDFLYIHFDVFDIHIYEGVADGRNHLVLVAGASSESSGRKSVLTAISPDEPQGFEREMWDRSEGGVLRALFSVKPILSLVPKEDRASTGSMMGAFCGEFSTIAVRADESDSRYEVSIWADLTESSGVLGTMMVPLQDGQGLVGWVPEETEFQSVSLNLETVSQFVGLLGAAPTDLSEIAEELSFLDGIEPNDVLPVLDGRLLAVTRPLSAEEVLDIDREEAVVFAVGTIERTGVLDEWLAALGIGAADRPLASADELGRGVRSIDLDGRMYVAERDHVVLIAIGEQSEGLMKRILDTNGRAPLPTAFEKRIDDLPPDSVLIGVGSTVTGMAGRFAQISRRSQSEVDPVMRRVFLEHLQEIERRGRSTYSGWIAVDEDGLKGRFVY